MKLWATKPAPHMVKGAGSSTNNPHATGRREQWWEPVHLPNECHRPHSVLHFASHRNASSSVKWHHVVRFFAYFSGPIIWGLEITAALMIVLTHSLDFVGVVIIANLVMIVVTMAFRTSLGLWRDSHPSSTIDILERRPSHHRFGLHLR